MKKLVLGGTIAFGVVLAASSALGQGAKPAAPPKAAPAAKAAPVAKAKMGASKLDLKEAKASLESSEPARIETALVNIRMAGKDGGGRQATALIVDRLEKGLPRELLKKALETLTDLEDPAGVPGCDIYMSHRDAEVRIAAIKCLGAAKGPVAVKSIRAALGDADPRVHATAATLLGEAKANEAVPDLIVALDKGVNESAVSIGQLCAPAQGECDQLLNRMKSKPLDVIFSGLQQVLTRKDVPDDYKKKVITQVRELASAKAREFLESVKKAWPPGGSKPVAEALDKAIKDLEGAK